jgi:O-succinylbenzoate synthase
MKLRGAAEAVMEQLKHGWVEESDPVAQDLKAALAETNQDEIHSCSYYCINPACIKAQRDELRDKLENMKGNPNEDVQGYGV